MNKPRGESQRVYWQQWLSSNSNKGNRGRHSRRELITSSAAIRINPDSAKARDVTDLLRKTLNLSSLESSAATGSGSESNHGSGPDSLVLVGTLYSLPKDYVQFEHEPPTRDNPSGNGTNAAMSSSSDPFHVIKTLNPDDNPLTVRDKMMDHLRKIQHQAPSTGSTISPKVQWYFVPSTSDPNRSPIPSCIDLDGYSTSMEEEDHLGDSDDEMISTNNPQHCNPALSDVEQLLAQCPFVKETREDESTMPVEPLSPKRGRKKSRHNRIRELRRFAQLNQVQPCGSGYLLKRSRLDPHVWRKVHCILTNDSLWYTTRVPYSKESTDELEEFPRMGRFHRRIALSQALLLEPNPDISSSPLFGIPHSFEVVSSLGTSHIFRTPDRAVQRQWVQALSTKIMESFENSLLDHVELIVTDESKARNSRFQSIAVDPVYCPPDTQNGSMYLSIIQAGVLRLGMDIAEYREKCRQMQALINASMINQAMSRNGSESYESSRVVIVERLQKVWDTAMELFERAMQVAMDVQQYANVGGIDREQASTYHDGILSRSLETHFRHVEYVLTGHHRSSIRKDDDTPENHSPRSLSADAGQLNRGRDSPPIDLFDLLLCELQKLICLPSKR